MMYEEFCEAVGMKIDVKCYKRIEQVYMAFDRFNCRQDIADFYKQHDMNGIETLYKQLHRCLEIREHLRNIESERRELTAEINETLVVAGITI